MRAARAYLSNDVDTSVGSFGPGQIIVLIYERTLDHLRLAKLSLNAGEYGIEHFNRAHDLIQKGLLACLNPVSGGEVAENLGLIYQWALREMINARLNKSPEKVQEILDVLTPLYEAWLVLTPKEKIANISQGDGFVESAQAINF